MGPQFSDPGSGTPTSSGLADGVAPVPLRRLSRAEYNNTLRDLLGNSTRPADAFAGDLNAGGSGYGQGGTVSPVEARQFMEASEALGTIVLQKLAGLLPCTPMPTITADKPLANLRNLRRHRSKSFEFPKGYRTAPKQRIVSAIRSQAVGNAILTRWPPGKRASSIKFCGANGRPCGSSIQRWDRR